MRRWRFLSLFCFLSLVLSFGWGNAAVAQESAPEVLTLEIDGPVNQGMAMVFGRAIAQAEASGAQAVLITLDTPGGALDATLDIVQLFRNAAVPVVVYIAPSGAQAASAGSIITLAAHASGMAPQTVIGAASPVSGGGEDIQETMYRKVVEDMKATVRGLAERRGERVAVLAEAMIEEATAVTSLEALEAGFVDAVAMDAPSLLAQLDGLTVVVGEQEQALQTAGATLTAVQLSGVERFLYALASILMNPIFISALMGIGVQAIIYEISNPGGWVAGFIGVLCLVLAMYGLGQLPANYFGVGLVLIAFVLFVMEFFTPTYGALAVTGAATLLAGLLITFNSPGTPAYARIPVVGAVAMTAVIAGFFLFVFGKVVAAQRKKPYSGKEGLIGKVGRARQDFAADGLGYRGTVFVYGALWQAEAREAIGKGQKVLVQEVEGLIMRVKKL